MTELMTLEVQQARGEMTNMPELEARRAALDRQPTALAHRINELRADDSKQVR